MTVSKSRLLQNTDEENGAYCERVEDPQDAHFWSVYGHLREGGVECLEDFPSEAEARTFADRLLATFPNLRKYGILTPCL